MTPEEMQNALRPALLKMGERLVECGFAEFFEGSDTPGSGRLGLTASGVVLSDAVHKIFRHVAGHPHELSGFEAVALLQLLLRSEPLSNN